MGASQESSSRAKSLLALRDVESRQTSPGPRRHGGLQPLSTPLCDDRRGERRHVALGEIWYAEADTPLGPWVYARKIVTHEKYSFYNPRHHPMFDQAGRPADFL